MGMKRIAGLLLLLLALALAGGASAQGAVRMEAEIGYEGLIAYIKEMPVRVTLTNEGGDVSGTVSVEVYRSAREYDVYQTPVTLAAGAVKDVTLYVTPMTVQTEFEIAFTPDNGDAVRLLAAPAQSHSPATVLVGALSETPNALSYMNVTESTDTLLRGEYFQIVPLTARTFPQTRSALEAFSMLVIDGVDARALDEACLKALDGWLNAGGVLLVGGGAQAAADYPYTQPYTGLSAGALTEGADVQAALLSYVMSARAPIGQAVPVNAVTGAESNPLIALPDGTPLMYVHEVGTGRVITCAFSLSDKPLSVQSSMRGLWQSVMLAAMPERYTAMVDESHNSIDSVQTYTLTEMKVENKGSLIPALLICFAFILLASFGSYFVLKRFDKREWMWAAVPALAILCTLAMTLIGGGMGLSRPMVVAQAFVRQDETGAVRASAVLGAVWREKGEMVLSVPDSLSLKPSEGAYYDDYYDDEAPPERKLKYRFVQGDEPGIAYRPSAPWTVNTAQTELAPPEGYVGLSVWMEPDGLHATVTNNMAVPLPQGYLLSADGYCVVPAIAQNAAAECAILRDPSPDGYIHDGRMITDLAMQKGNADMYSIIRAAIFPESQSDDYKGDTYGDTRQTDYDIIYQSVMNNVDNMNESAGFHYVTITDGIVPLRVFMGGEPVERVGQVTLLDAKARYSPVSPTGHAYYPRGLIAATEASALETPVDTHVTASNWYMLSDAPCFCFVIPDSERLTVSALSVQAEYYYEGELITMLYNARTNAWDTFKGKKSLTLGDEASDYINARGELFLCYKAGSGAENYADVRTPKLTVEGSVR